MRNFQFLNFFKIFNYFALFHGRIRRILINLSKFLVFKYFLLFLCKKDLKPIRFSSFSRQLLCKHILKSIFSSLSIFSFKNQTNRSSNFNLFLFNQLISNEIYYVTAQHTQCYVIIDNFSALVIRQHTMMNFLCY